ncbi:EI24 domain-containing protein [Pararhodobacter sp.]|uniref:EI24 domain-containing protein n=1 Tax=Pararhodobacter sp. TaxID=2127056 RepID=UPI002AFF0212|nr:EI24 domain-containing protein [Pararhodobacter sp.]
MILGAIAAAFGQWSDPKFRRALWFGLALAIALLFAMYAAVLMVVQIFTPDALTLLWVGEVHGIATLLSFASLAFMLVLSIFLMVPVASAFTGLFLDDVADAVEARHYAQLPQAPRAPFLTSLVNSLRYFGVLVALNLLGMVLFIFSGGLGMIALWLINGYLLSREYFTMIALRRLPPQAAHAMRRDNRFRLWTTGVLMAVPLSIPVVNLFMPVVAAATFTHLYHRLRA